MCLNTGVKTHGGFFAMRVLLCSGCTELNASRTANIAGVSAQTEVTSQSVSWPMPQFLFFFFLEKVYVVSLETVTSKMQTLFCVMART